MDWLVWLMAAVTLVGLAAIRMKALRGYGALLLAMTLFGWVYSFTDWGHILEVRLVHIVFGILFSLSWVALGCTLLRGEGKVEHRTTCAPGSWELFLRD